MQYNEFFRIAAAAAGGWLWMTLGPAVPYGVVCTLMVGADLITARRLARRLRRKVPDGSARRALKFSSAGLGRAVRTLGRIYGLLMLAAMVDAVIVGGHGLLLKFAAGAVCFWQSVSILENEAACNPHPWACILRRILIDKTERYLGVTLDELRKSDPSEK